MVGCNLHEKTAKFINNSDLFYSELTGKEKEKVIVDCITKLFEDRQKIAAPERTKVWHDGWQENCDLLKASTDIEKSLLPKFVREIDIVRINGKFCRSESKYFEKLFVDCLLNFLFYNFCTDYDEVHEFGTGSAYNIFKFSQEDPDKKYFGYDFVQSSVDCVNILNQKTNSYFKGELYNFLEPGELNFGNNAVAFTFGALEQTKGGFKEYIDLLANSSVKEVFHIEPTVENYTEDTVEDTLAKCFHLKRGYSTGLKDYLSNHKDINFNYCKRIGFGNKMFEGYHLYSWSPKNES